MFRAASFPVHSKQTYFLRMFLRLSEAGIMILWFLNDMSADKCC